MPKPHIKVVQLSYAPHVRAYAMYTDRTCTKRIDLSGSLRTLSLLAVVRSRRHSAAFTAPKPCPPALMEWIEEHLLPKPEPTPSLMERVRSVIATLCR
jgi:hypothetical protein